MIDALKFMYDLLVGIVQVGIYLALMAFVGLVGLALVLGKVAIVAYIFKVILM